MNLIIMSKFKPSAYFIVILSLVMTIPTLICAQDVNYYDKNFIRNQDAIYKDNIKTVLLYKQGDELSPPIIQLNTDDKLFLSFDDMDNDLKQYRYTFIHCDAYWNKSDIQQMEYIDGFSEDNIDNYIYSFNTTRPYTNYTLTFPGDYMKIRKSGNYILKVYDTEDRDENVILTYRFMVLDTKVDVDASVVKTYNLNYRYTKQQVDFSIISNNYTISDAYRNIHVLVMQNGRWDNAILNIQPISILGNVFDYSNNDKIVFDGGNEFRYFDMKTLKYNTDRMQGLQYTQDGYQVYLLTDKSWAGIPYRSEQDIDGKRLIAANDTQDPNSEADYAWVHFSLAFSNPPTDGNLYIYGALTYWQFLPEAKMVYNYDKGVYEGKLYLKQGYYNYDYMFLKDGTNLGNVSLTEGSHWETENDYTIYIYHREQGDFYDKLIAVRYLNSVNR